MKVFFKSLAFVAVALVAFSSCSSDNDVATPDDEHVVDRPFPGNDDTEYTPERPTPGSPNQEL